MMRGYGVLDQILPEAGQVTRLRLINWLTTRAVVLDGVAPDGLRNLAALLDTDAEGAAGVAARLRLSNAQTDRLITLVAPEEKPSPDLGDVDREKLLRHIGTETFRDLVLLGWADEMGGMTRLPSARAAAWTELLAWALAWEGAAFPLKGQDLLDLGVAPGPRVGEVLKRVETWWADGGYSADRGACLDLARRIIGGDHPT